jgi:peptide/nickel transport system substrate-binding protein
MDHTLIIAQPRLRMAEPHDCTDARDVQAIFMSLFDPLAAFDPNMKVVPALAESWRVSDDARTWTFRLRRDARFHHGRSVDAEAVAYSLQRMARPDMGVTLGAPGVYNQYLAGMKLEILDRHTVRLALADPLADLMDILVTGYILPPDAVDRLGDQFKTAPIGTGPFQFVEHHQGVRVRVKRTAAIFSLCRTSTRLNGARFRTRTNACA